MSGIFSQSSNLSGANPNDYLSKQNLKLVNVDINNFPEVNLILEISPNLINQIASNNIKLLQNGIPQKILSMQQISSNNKVPVDFVFVIDRTGSMSDEIEIVKTNIKKFILNIVNKGIDYQFGLVVFSDIVDNTYDFTPSADKVLDYLSPIVARGGGDSCENALEALYSAYNLSFRKESLKFIFLLTDALFHYKEHTGDGYTNLKFDDVVSYARKKNIANYCIVPLIYTPYLALSDSTGGKYYNITDNFSSILDYLFEDISKLYTIKYQYSDFTLPDSIVIDILDKSSDNILVSQKASFIEINKKLVLDNQVLFDFNKSSIKPEFLKSLDRIVKFLKMRESIEVSLKGYTDNIGTEEYNLNLSRARAESVKNYLLRLGVDDNRVITQGYGKNYPIAPNDTEEGRAKNRRTEVVIIKK